MVFYNGFNLLVDLILVAVVFLASHGIGYQKGKRQANRIAKTMLKHPAYRNK